jgi:hypothetical protein
MWLESLNWEDNIRIYPKEIDISMMNLIELAHVGDH